jgi:major membrane immunogen (membrane-anchored lipoprotein)
MRTFYTYKPILSNTGNAFNSNVNSASDRMLDTHYHFLNGLKMASGEVNQCFYDFNNGNKNNKNDDAQSLQSLSDSKMLELANMYLKDEDNSVENYQMNNIIYNKKKKNVK